eukprot:990423_1
MLTKQLKRISQFGTFYQYSSYKLSPLLNHSTYNNSTTNKKKILIIGANGNLGSKLTKHWMNTHELFLVDKNSSTSRINKYFLDAELMHHHFTIDLLKDCNDISTSTLSKLICKSDIIIHFAANNPFPEANWSESLDTIDMINNTLLSCINSENLKNEKKTRIIFASSNHCMGGYRKEG